MEKEPKPYQMTAHVFGAVSSPGCANYGLKKAAEDGEEAYGQEAANFVRHNFYVDDGLTSTDNVDQAKELIKDTQALCAAKGLRLHKFISNEQGALKDVPVEDCRQRQRYWT